MDLWPDVIPIAPHVYCTQFLDDTIPQEREAGMELGIALLDMCDELWVYGHKQSERRLEKGNRLRQGARDPGKRRRRPLPPPGAGEKPQEDKELGDALLVLPTHTGAINGVAAFESTTVRISGEVIVELAAELRRNRGHDITVEAEA